jgi:hypothetical protein
MQIRTIPERREGPTTAGPRLFCGVAFALAVLIASPVAASDPTQLAGLIRAPLPVVITPVSGSPATFEGMVVDNELVR